MSFSGEQRTSEVRREVGDQPRKKHGISSPTSQYVLCNILYLLLQIVGDYHLTELNHLSVHIVVMAKINSYVEF